VRAELDPALRQALERALLSLGASHEGSEVLAQLGIQRFVKTTAADYQGVFELARQAGVDLARYEYVDD
jgi:ABC-type phosphate/phosphonate transport system substrate-binding protein